MSDMFHLVGIVPYEYMINNDGKDRNQRDFPLSSAKSKGKRKNACSQLDASNVSISDLTFSEWDRNIYSFEEEYYRRRNFQCESLE